MPSGLQWANFNVGAEKPEDPGLYFSWGNIIGHKEGEGYDFTQEVYDSTPAAGIATDLSLNQDAARAYLGDPWRMPSADDFRELFDNCDSVWTTLNGMNGRLLTSNVNGNTLFLPAGGIYGGTTLYDRGGRGDYWSTTFSSDTKARGLNFNSAGFDPRNDIDRRFGFTVRAVLPPL